MTWFLILFLPFFDGENGPEPISSRTMAKVESCVNEKTKLYGSDQVLIVFDIDNTLLAMNQAFGSDQWFNWQYLMLNDDNNNAGQMAKSMSELLSLQRELFTLSQMHPPEAITPGFVMKLQREGYVVMAMTSRGPTSRDATERELARNDYDLSKTKMGMDLPGRFHIGTDTLKARLSKDDQKQFKLDHEPRQVSYCDGIFMTEGQHKGAMLVALLERQQKHFKAIIMVDDHIQNCSRVAMALHRFYNANESKEDDVDIVTVHYLAEEEHVKSFHESDKTEVMQAWTDYLQLKQHFK